MGELTYPNCNIESPGDGNLIHVYPVNDMRDHITEGAECWCEPQKQAGGMLIVHNSMDGRELIEQHGLQ